MCGYVRAAKQKLWNACWYRSGCFCQPVLMSLLQMLCPKSLARSSFASSSYCIIGGYGWGGRVVVLQPEGRQFSPQSSQQNLHAEVSLKMYPELCLIKQPSVANRCTVWMCVWLRECKNCTVKSFEWSSRLEKCYINTNPFTIITKCRNAAGK